MDTTLRQQILFDKLYSDLGIYEAKYKQERNFSMNTQKQVDSSITEAIILEIKNQISELEKEIEKQNNLN